MRNFPASRKLKLPVADDPSGNAYSGFAIGLEHRLRPLLAMEGEF
jgi:hypothetical protein